MRKFFQSRGSIVILATIAVLAILAAVTYSGRSSVTWMEDAVNTVTSPVQTVAVSVSDGIVNFFKRVFKTTDADLENAQLKVKIAQYENVEEEIKVLQDENQRLKELLNFTDITNEYDYVTGTVIGKSQGIWFSEFTVNAGRNDGVEENMAVVNAGGLVGCVSSVSASTCKITTIIDSASDISVMVERTRDYGFVRGTLAVSSKDMLELYYLPSGYDLVPGDLVVTSGIGDEFPKNITVGKVTEVSRANEDAQDHNAIIQPSVDFRHLEEVMIVLGEKGE